MSEDTDRSRRRFVGMLIAAPLGLVVGTRAWAEALAAGTARAVNPPGADSLAPPRDLAPTPECDDGDEPTPPETEGPFFTPDSPLRGSLLAPSIAGTRMVLTGHVFTRECRPIAGALLDFWHADDDGEYDNVGYRLRGHQFTDANGRYRLETIVPGRYPGRTRHFHVKVQAPRGRILTTQLYFPGEPRNARDFLFRSALLMEVKEGGAAKQARFPFMLDRA
jgi:protocatechuate 3,4-dioxygenase beta subunit